MLAFTNVFDLFSNKLTRLRARSLPFPLIFPGTVECLFFWHARLLLACMKSIRLRTASAHEFTLVFLHQLPFQWQQGPYLGSEICPHKQVNLGHKDGRTRMEQSQK